MQSEEQKYYTSRKSYAKRRAKILHFNKKLCKAKSKNITLQEKVMQSEEQKLIR